MEKKEVLSVGMLKLYGLRGMTDKAQASALLARSAVETWGLHKLPAVVKLAAGKPVFRGEPELHFNLSHSGNFALCALSDRPVGVDIEALRPRRDGLAEYILSPTELEWYHAQGSTTEALLTLWTRKEALCKYRGTGLTFPVRDITPPLPGDPAGPPFVRSMSGGGWTASVCAELVATDEIIWFTHNDLKGDTST